MRLHVIHSLPIVLIAIMSLPPFSAAQQNNDSPTTNPPPASPSASAKATGPLSDYVPCTFMENDRFSMRALPLPAKVDETLDKATAEMLFEKADAVIQNALDSFNPTPEFREAFDSVYTGRLTRESLSGLTREQAIARIEYVVRKATEEARTKAPQAVRQLTNEEIGDRKAAAAATLPNAVGEKVLPLFGKKGNDNSSIVAAGRKALENATFQDDEYKNHVLGKYDNYTRPLVTKGFRLDELETAVEKAANGAQYPPAPRKNPDQITQELAGLNETASGTLAARCCTNHSRA